MGPMSTLCHEPEADGIEGMFPNVPRSRHGDCESTRDCTVSVPPSVVSVLVCVTGLNSSEVNRTRSSSESPVVTITDGASV